MAKIAVQMGWSGLLAGVVGAFALGFLSNWALYWLAHQMTWWTYAAATSGSYMLWLFVTSLWKELRKPQGPPPALRRRRQA